MLRGGAFTKSKKTPKRNPISPFGAASSVDTLMRELCGDGIPEVALLRLRGEPGRACRLMNRPMRASYNLLDVRGGCSGSAPYTGDREGEPGSSHRLAGPPSGVDRLDGARCRVCGRVRAPPDEVLPHISHIKPAGLTAISNKTARCSRIAEHSGYHEC